MRVVGVVLTGGRSSRMGRPKALLDLGGQSFLERVLHALRDAGIDELIVVTGEHDRAIRSHLAHLDLDRPAPLKIVVNPDPSAGQLSSLLVALALVSEEAETSGLGAETAAAGAADAVVMALVDHPLVCADTVRRLLQTFEAVGAPVVRPVFAGRHGHPVLFSGEVFSALRSAPPEAGARAVVRALGGRVRDVPVEDPGVVQDIDTPEAYERARQTLAAGRRLPPSDARSADGDAER